MQPFFNIPLNLSNTLEQSLDQYVAEQLLCDENLYQTEIFGPQVAKKSVKFLVLPPIIMVQLKRFEFNYYKGVNQKIMRKFEYPNIVDFSRWQYKPTQASQYQLYAVLVHEGIQAESGHYYAYVKIKDEWFRFNDQQVSKASKIQVFQYNFGGEIQLAEFNSRQFNVKSRKSVSSSTAYMLVYVKSELKQKLLDCGPKYPEWLQQHEVMKQEQREQMRNRKNFFHDVQVLDWETSIKGSVASYLGLIPKNVVDVDVGGETIEKISKSDNLKEWIRPYCERNFGVYLYMANYEKIQYQILLNCHHRNCTFQQIVRDLSTSFNVVLLPMVANQENLVCLVKLLSPILRIGMDGEQQSEISMKFFDFFQMNKNVRNSEVLRILKNLYDQPDYRTKYYFQYKKQLHEITDNNILIKAPSPQRNVLQIIIVEKIPLHLSQKFVDPTISWYNDLKNFVQITIKSEDGKHVFQTQMDQNNSLESLRDYIYYEKMVEQDLLCPSPENIVLKGKLKKASKNFIEIPGAKVIKDLIKNCQKDNIITFSLSNLKANQRINQMEVKFIYRFQDFTFSEPFHVVLDRQSDNKSSTIYTQICKHQDVQRFKQKEGKDGIRVFLFSKDRNVINDIIFENGHVHGKGEVANVLQKQKGCHIVVQGFCRLQIEEIYCPILIHHRTLNDEKIGTPRYIQFQKTAKLTDVYGSILELIKDEMYEWQEKKIKCNPMKVSLYAYAKDYSKGIYLYDEGTLISFAMEQEKAQSSKQKTLQAIKEEDENIDIQKIDEKKQVGSNQAIQSKQKQQKQRNQVMIESSEEQKQKNVSNQNSAQSKKAESTSKNLSRKNQLDAKHLQSWEKTIQHIFPKAKVLKIVIHHPYISKAQMTMKINI